MAVAPRPHPESPSPNLVLSVNPNIPSFAHVFCSPRFVTLLLLLLPTCSSPSSPTSITFLDGVHFYIFFPLTLFSIQLSFNCGC